MMSRTLVQIASDHVFLTWLTCIGLLLFLGVFVGALVWITRRERTDLYQSMALLPLTEEIRK